MIFDALESVRMSVRVKLTIHQTEINRLIGSELDLTLETGSCIVDVIKAVDEEISKKTAKFPVKGYRSLLHMTYHPTEERFYKQVAVQAYEKPGVFLPVRQNPKMPLPDEAMIILIPEGPCISEWEDVVG